MEVLEATTHNIATERQKMFDYLSAMGSDLIDEVNISKDLAALNITTELTEMVDATLRNPLKSSLSAYLELERGITYQLDQVVRDFLKSKKRLIHKAYKTYDDASLHYCIILHKDNLTNRGKLYELTKRFIYSGMAQRFPLVFQFVPKELENDLKANERIEL
jgi:hypothetical protein